MNSKFEFKALPYEPFPESEPHFISPCDLSLCCPLPTLPYPQIHAHRGILLLSRTRRDETSRPPSSFALQISNRARPLVPSFSLCVLHSRGPGRCLGAQVDLLSALNFSPATSTRRPHQGWPGSSPSAAGPCPLKLRGAISGRHRGNSLGTSAPRAPGPQPRRGAPIPQPNLADASPRAPAPGPGPAPRRRGEA